MRYVTGLAPVALGFQRNLPVPRLGSKSRVTSTGGAAACDLKLQVLLQGPHTPLSSLARTCQKYLVSGLSRPAAGSAYCGLPPSAGFGKEIGESNPRRPRRVGVGGKLEGGVGGFFALGCYCGVFPEKQGGGDPPTPPS